MVLLLMIFGKIPPQQRGLSSPGATPRPCQRLALRACLVLGDGQRGLVKRGGRFVDQKC